MTDVTTLYEQIRGHLASVHDDPTIQLDERLLLEADAFLATQLRDDKQRLLELVVQISTLLPTLQQDPNLVIRLLQKLVVPFSFSDILQLQPPVDFVAALDVAAQPFHRLVLELLGKAAERPQDAALLAGMPRVVLMLVKLWLSTSDMGTADAAQGLILRLLKTDKEPAKPGVSSDDVLPIADGSSHGQGLIWRRLFGDKDVYGLLYSCCSLGPHGDAALPKNVKTIAQARLMAILPKIGLLDWSYMSRSHQPDIEDLHGLSPSDYGLLDYVSLHMVDYKNDVLIHMNLLQYFTELISIVKQASIDKPRITVSLEYLMQRGLHKRAMSYWLTRDDPKHDPIDIAYLYNISAKYFSVYVSQYPHDFLENGPVRQTLTRLSSALDITAGRWAHGQSPSQDLSVLAALPRVALLPQDYLGSSRRSSPLLLVPCKNTNSDALHTLARIFAGPLVQEVAPIHQMIKVGDDWTLAESAAAAHTDLDVSLPDTSVAEAAAARALFITYLHYHDTLFVDLIAHAETVALPDKALAALQLISSIISANWKPLPADSSYSAAEQPSSPASLPSEDALRGQLPRLANFPVAFANTGVEVLLQSPMREMVVPYMLRAPQVFSNLVGGLGDAESAAYRVAMAKWDVLKAFYDGMKKLQTQGESAQGREVIMAAVEERMREGPWGAAEQAGGRIATMEL